MKLLRLDYVIFKSMIPLNHALILQKQELENKAVDSPCHFSNNHSLY